MIIKKISNLFLNEGVVLENNNNKSLMRIDRKLIINLFVKHGIIIFKNFNFKKKDLTKFTDKFTHRYANDATRREIKFNNKKINTVDLGYNEMSLHSEASFSPSWPEILWFICISPSIKSGFTTICDGSKIYEKLDYKTKQFFLKNPIQYELKIPFKKNLDPNSVILNKSKNDLKSWLLNSPGTFDTKISLKNGFIYTKYLKYAVVETKIPGVLSFCNHLLAVFGTDPQILSCKLGNGDKIPKKIYEEIRRVTKKLTIEIKWKKNEICMIDNRRFMHGRTKILKGEKREILNLQTLYSNLNIF